MENLRGSHQEKTNAELLYDGPGTSSKGKEYRLTYWQTRHAKQQTKGFHLGTLNGSLERGRRNVVPRIIKPGQGFYEAGKLLCIQKAAILSHNIPVSLPPLWYPAKWALGARS